MKNNKKRKYMIAAVILLCAVVYLTVNVKISFPQETGVNKGAEEIVKQEDSIAHTSDLIQNEQVDSDENNNNLSTQQVTQKKNKVKEKSKESKANSEEKSSQLNNTRNKASQHKDGEKNKKPDSDNGNKNNENKNNENNNDHLDETDKKKEEKEKLTCTLSIDCTTILSNMSLLKKSKEDIIPDQGIILPKITVTFEQGETAYSILVNEAKKNGIHMDSQHNQVYSTAYVRGIANIYEKDCGAGSGWTYLVNQKTYSYSASQCKLQDGDEVRWRFTCLLGDVLSN